MISSLYHPEPELFGEPTLDELLADPIIQLVMKRDGVAEDEMRGQLDRVQRSYEMGNA